MSTPSAIHPLPFDPAFERVPDDEADTTRELIDVLRTILETTSDDYQHAVRSVHAKSHGLLDAELTVLDGLPPVLAQGLFATPGNHPIVMRLSTNPGDILDDSVSTPRGLAIKVADVAGPRVAGSGTGSESGSESGTSQDFVMVNAPAFNAATPKVLLANLKLLARTTDRMPGAKKALSAVLRGAEHIVEAVGGESGTLKSLGGHPRTHILGETFYTCAPILYGEHFAKLSVAPVSPELLALKDAALDGGGHPDALREAVTAFFQSQGGEWEVRVQLATDIEKMPIEDVSVRWPEDESPYVAVARIRAPAQAAWTPERSRAIDDGLLFSPWNALAAHRPLGGMMRVRQAAYQWSAEFRSAFNRCPVHR